MQHRRRMVIGSILDGYGSHPAAWISSDTLGDRATDFSHFAHLARLAEAAKFDYVFISDSPSIPDGDLASLCRQTTRQINAFEPITLLAALATQTTDIGLAATVSTSYSEPFNVARMFASLDHLSHGRAAWNVVTTSTDGAARNFGQAAAAAHDERYERAAEFVDVVRGLWDGWEDGAVILDRAAGRYLDPDKVRRLDHKGRFFSVRGPLNISRPPQGHPVLIQAGASEAGRALSAAIADMIFIIAGSLDEAQSFGRDLERRLKAKGRNREDVTVVHGVTVVVGDTPEAVQSKMDQHGNNIHESIGKDWISTFLETDLSGLAYDAPIPEERIPLTTNGAQTYFNRLRLLATQQRKTIRQLAAAFAQSRIGNSFTGTPSEIADQMQAWFEAGGSDGFMVRNMVYPESLEEFCRLVVPELQRRGLMQRDYAPGTLRQRLRS